MAYSGLEKTTKNLINYFLLPALLINVAVWTVYTRFQPDFLLHINFYDVGQGDAIFVQTYLGNQILIDGGPSDKVLSELGKDLPFFDRSIDLVILTHPHADHVSGLVDILKRYKIKQVLLPEVEFHSGAYDEFLKLADEKKISKIFAHEGQRIYLDHATVLDIYYPSGKVLGSSFEDGFTSVKSQDLNDGSIVGKLSFGKNQILLAGDAGSTVEQQLLPKYDLDVDLLKVGHHGSKHSTSEEFLQEVTPEYAVIEVGKNSYGHPTEEVLSNLIKAQATIYRTDRDNTVRFVSDGLNLYKN